MKHSLKINTAYHEAGHAVAAYGEGVKFKYITLKREADSNGHVALAQFPRGFVPEYPRYCDRRYIESRIIICFAGPLSEARFKGSRYRLGAWKDYRDAIQFADLICGSNRQVETYLSWLQARTEDLLDMPHHWSAIEALADALVERETIDAPAAAEIIHTAFQRPAEPKKVRTKLSLMSLT